MSRVLLYTGPARSDRAECLDRLVAEHWGRAVLLVPTPAHAVRRREALVRGSGRMGLWGQCVYEFTDFAAALLDTQGARVRRLGDFERKLLLDNCLAALAPKSARVRAFWPEAAQPQGTLRHLLRVITQLKQAALEPDDFRARIGGRAQPVDFFVAETYEAYQAALKASDAYDVPGIYWAAEACCHATRPALLDGVDALLLDGFDDFTPSQFRFVRALAPHVELLAFGMAHDSAPDRQDLYRITAEAVAHIQGTFDVSQQARPVPAPLTEHAHAADVFLSRDRSFPPPSLSPTLEFAACLDAPHEIELIARIVKSLVLDQQVHPADIAVVYRDVGEAAPILRDVFRECGIPVQLRHRPPLAQSSLGAFLLRLLRGISTWEREAVLDLLVSPWMAPPEHSEAFPRLARAAGIVEGEPAWHSQLERLAGRISASSGREIRHLLACLPQAAVALEALRANIALLSGIAASFPVDATPAAYCAAVTQTLGSLDVAARMDALADSEFAEGERSALAALHALLPLLERAVHDGPLPRAAWIARFAQGLDETPYALPSARHGVAVLDAPAVRNLRFAHVFFAGLNEGIIPAAPPANVFYAEREVERLRAAGIALEGRRHHGDRERLLFHHVLESAQQQLHLSWRLAKENGQEAARSPFVLELLDRFPGHPSAAAGPTGDAFIPQPEQAASFRELRNAAYRHAPALRREGEATAHFADTAHAAAIEGARGDHSPFGVYDGRIADEAIRAELRETFGAKRVYSVNQLETFAECPFRYFAARLLNVEEAEMPSTEVPPRVLGILLHEALRHFHSRHHGLSLLEIPEAAIEASLSQALDAAFRRAAAELASVPDGVRGAERGRLALLLERYVAQWRTNEELPWKPTHFEAAFGRAGAAEGADLLSKDAPYAYETALGPVLLAGRIDRIDVAGSELRLVDYKSGALPPVGHITSGRAMQLSLYAYAVEAHLLPDASCTEAIYLRIGHRKPQTSLSGRSEAWQQREENLRRATGNHVSAMRAGHFPPTPAKDACSYCTYRDACRYEENRIEAKLEKCAKA